MSDVRDAPDCRIERFPNGEWVHCYLIICCMAAGEKDAEMLTCLEQSGCERVEANGAH